MLKKVEEKPKPKAESKTIQRKRKLLDSDEDSENDEHKKVLKKFKGKTIRFYVRVMIYVHFFILLSLDIDGSLLVITDCRSSEQVLMVVFW